MFRLKQEKVLNRWEEAYYNGFEAKGGDDTMHKSFVEGGCGPETLNANSVLRKGLSP